VLTYLHQIDTELFNFINQTGNSAALDFVMRTLSSALLGWALVLSVTLYLVFRRKWSAVRTAAVLIAAVVVTDVLCFRVIKPTAQRIRPCFQQNARVVVEACGTPYTFPSNHAANAMAAATVLGLYFPMYAPLTVLVAFLVGLSRVYVGVHYPFDVLAGFLIGMAVAGVIFSGAQRLPKGRLAG
jgi:undecaprenyl-diphosphatase